MVRSNYPTNPWLLNFIAHQERSRSATTLHVLKPLGNPVSDGCKMMQVGDGELTLKALFAADSFERLEDSEDEKTWERSLISIRDWDLRLLLGETKEKCEFIIDIKRFFVWSDEKGLSMKNTMVPCESHPQIQETIARFWAENLTSTQSIPDPPEDLNQTLSSVALSILLEQIERTEELSIQNISNAGSLRTVSVENMRRNLETEDDLDLIISPKDGELLEAIVEWRKGYHAPENPEESVGGNAAHVLGTTSTLKNQCKSPKDSEKPIAIQSTGDERPEPQEKIASPRSNKDVEEEENRLFSLSSVSNEQGKCTPLKKLDKSFRNDAQNVENPSKTVAPSRVNVEIPASGMSSASQSNKEFETSSEIPMSGKVASNYNRSKSTPDELHCSLLDSSQESNSGHRLPRWNNLDLSSIESQSSVCADKSQREAAQGSKRIKLIQASGSIRVLRFNASQNSLSNQPHKKISEKNSSTKLDAISKSSPPKLIKTVSDDNKVSSVYSHEKYSVDDGLIEKTLSSSKKDNLQTCNSSSSQNICEVQLQPIEIYATTQELFPKHPACAKLLPANQQLTIENNLNDIRLPKETMETINTYWSLSHLWQPRPL